MRGSFPSVVARESPAQPLSLSSGLRHHKPIRTTKRKKVNSEHILMSYYVQYCSHEIDFFTRCQNSRGSETPTSEARGAALPSRLFVANL